MERQGEARCAVSRPLEDNSRCEGPGEVRFRGAQLCAPHAAMLEAAERIEHWEETFFHLQLWTRRARELGNEDLVRFLEPGLMLSEIKLDSAQEKLDRAREFINERSDVRHLRLVG